METAVRPHPRGLAHTCSLWLQERPLRTGEARLALYGPRRPGLANTHQPVARRQERGRFCSLPCLLGRPHRPITCVHTHSPIHAGARTQRITGMCLCTHMCVHTTETGMCTHRDTPACTMLCASVHMCDHVCVHFECPSMHGSVCGSVHRHGCVRQGACPRVCDHSACAHTQAHTSKLPAPVPSAPPTRPGHRPVLSPFAASD